MNNQNPTLLVAGPAPETVKQKAIPEILRQYRNALDLAQRSLEDEAVRQVVLDAITDIDKLGPVDEADLKAVEQANERYCLTSDNAIEIDAVPMLSRGDDGDLVSAWVWIPRQDDKDED